MSEATVQVPVSLIEALRDAHGGPDLDEAAGAVIELLPDSFANAHAEMDAITPSTIRDITPPPTTEES